MTRGNSTPCFAVAPRRSSQVALQVRLQPVAPPTRSSPGGKYAPPIHGLQCLGMPGNILGRLSGRESFVQHYSHLHTSHSPRSSSFGVRKPCSFFPIAITVRDVPPGHPLLFSGASEEGVRQDQRRFTEALRCLAKFALSGVVGFRVTNSPPRGRRYWLPRSSYQAGVPRQRKLSTARAWRHFHPRPRPKSILLPDPGHAFRRLSPVLFRSVPISCIPLLVLLRQARKLF